MVRRITNGGKQDDKTTVFGCEKIRVCSNCRSAGKLSENMQGS